MKKIKLFLALATFIVSVGAMAGVHYTLDGVPSVDYTSKGSAPAGGKTYALFNQTSKFLYFDGRTPKVSSTKTSFVTLEVTGSEFYFRTESGLLKKDGNWNTWADGGYGDDSKWITTLSDGAYTLRNHNKGSGNFFAPNSNGENIQCYCDKTNLTKWYFIDLSDKSLAISLLYQLNLAYDNEYVPMEDGDIKTTFGTALDNILSTYVKAESFSETTYDNGMEAINAAKTPVLKSLYNSAKNAANAALDNDDYVTVTGFERTQLSASVAKTVDETQPASDVNSAYKALIEEIEANLAAFTEAPAYYTLLATENTKANNDFGLSAQTTVSQSAKDAYHAQMVAEYNYVTTNYNTAIDLGSWTATNAVENPGGQHWDGTNTAYSEQKDGWGSNTAWTTSYTQDIVLPAGDYVFKVAGRHSQNSVLELIVKNGETILGSVNDFPKGDTGLGINKSGVTSFDPTDPAGFARGGSGGGWQWRYVPFTINEESATITISVEGGNPDEQYYQWVSFCNYTVQSKPSVAASRAAYNQAKATANEALEDATYTNVQGTDRSNLETAVNATPTETMEWYDAQTIVVQNLTTTFTSGVASWNSYTSNYPTEKAKADAISTTIAAGFVAPTTAAEAAAAVGNLMVAEYNYIIDNYTTSINLGNWNQEGGTTFNTSGGQHWSGDKSRGYWEQTYENYAAENWSISFNQTIDLPAGDYIFKVAGRHSGSSVMALEVTDVTDGENPESLGSVNDFPATGTGKGIATDGTANFTDGTFANNGAGYGFQWRYVPFTIDATTSVKIAVTASAASKAQWISFSDYEVLAIPNVEASKVVLQQAIDAAPAVRTTNVGSDPFQFATADVTAYSEALVAAQAAHDAGDATITSVENAKAALETAIETYNNLTINAPAANQLFNVILTYAGYQYDNKAITFIAGGGNASAGNYTIQYKEAANKNLAQAFTFTKVSGNNYKMSQIDADGVARYVSTGVPYGGNTAQIRTTTDASKALVVTVIPTATEGVYNLRNTEANQYIGSQDNGVYTVNSHINFNIVETTKPSITINTTAAGWGTTFLPFAVDALPTGVKAYTCAEVADNTLTLVEVDALEANNPYIIEGAWNETVTGDAQGIALTNTKGLLVGTYERIAAPNGSYVLQNGGEGVGFYLVDTSVATPYVPANRAYLNYSGNNVKAFIFGGGEDAIKSVFDGVAAGEVYDLSGRKVAKMQKGGAYIVNGKKVIVK